MEYPLQKTVLLSFQFIQGTRRRAGLFFQSPGGQKGSFGRLVLLRKEGLLRDLLVRKVKFSRKLQT